MNSREQRIADFRAGAKWAAQVYFDIAAGGTSRGAPSDAEIAQALGPQDDSIQRHKEDMLMGVAARDARSDALADVDVMLNDADIPAHVRGPLRDALRRMPGWGKNPSPKAPPLAPESSAPLLEWRGIRIYSGNVPGVAFLAPQRDAAYIIICDPVSPLVSPAKEEPK